MCAQLWLSTVGQIYIDSGLSYLTYQTVGQINSL